MASRAYPPFVSQNGNHACPERQPPSQCGSSIARWGNQLCRSPRLDVPKRRFQSPFLFYITPSMTQPSWETASDNMKRTRLVNLVQKNLPTFAEALSRVYTFLLSAFIFRRKEFLLLAILISLIAAT